MARVKALLGLATACFILLVSKADVASIYYSEFDGQTIDIDGDGYPEIAGTGFSFEEQRFYVSLDFDYTDIPGTFASANGMIFAGALSADAKSRDALRSASGFELNFVPPIILRRQERWPAGGYTSASEEDPITALWFYGSRGSGTEPLHLVALIIDATEYFSDNPAPFIHLYYHHYGEVVEGGVPFVSSLAETGFSTKLDEAFKADSEFTDVRRVRYFVPNARPGWRYQIYRRSSGRPTEMVKEVIGAGKGTILEWDDRSENARSAFFWLKEESDVELNFGF